MSAAMILGMIAASAIAAAQPATPAPPKEPTPAELKAENAQLKQQVLLLNSLVGSLRVQRNQSADQAAEVAARYDAMAQAKGRPGQ